MNQLFAFLLVAFLVQAIVALIARIMEKRVFWQNIVAFIIGAGSAWAFGLSLTALLGLTVVVGGSATLYIDAFLLGVAVMDGAGLLHDLLEKWGKQG